MFSVGSIWRLLLVSDNCKTDSSLFDCIPKILKILTNKYLPPAGAIIQYGSWRICMHAMGGAFALQVLMTLFFMPESAYHRTDVLDIDTTDTPINQKLEKESGFEHEEHIRAGSGRGSSLGPKKSFLRELLPYDGYWDDTSFWRTLIRPFFFLASPMVAWATLLFTTCISWLVLISITLSQIFAAPPYNFSVMAVGLTNLSSFVASLLATAAAGPVIDGLATFMSKKNKGIFGKPLLPEITPA